MRHQILPSTLNVAAVDVSEAVTGIQKLTGTTVTVECDGTWTSTTVRLLGKIGDGQYVPVGYVSGSGAKTLTAAGAFLVPEAVDALKLEATAYNATTGNLVGRIAGLDTGTV